MRPSSISFVEGEFRDLAADPVERREHHRLRGVVDDEVDAGQVLERADVAPLAADDSALHVVARELDDRDRRLGCVARGYALERVGDEVPGPALRLRARLLVELPDAPRELVATSSSERSSRSASPRPATCPATRSSSVSSVSFACFSSSWSSFGCASRGRRAPARGARARSASARGPAPRVRARAPRSWRSRRAAPATSCSISARSVTPRSRVSIWASRRIASASRSASAIRSFGACASLAEPALSSIAIVTRPRPLRRRSR